jgi:hypothetical protein
MQQSENGQRVGSTHEYLATGDGRRDELVSRAELVATAGGLVGVIELMATSVVRGNGCRNVAHRCRSDDFRVSVTSNNGRNFGGFCGERENVTLWGRRARAENPG